MSGFVWYDTLLDDIDKYFIRLHSSLRIDFLSFHLITPFEGFLLPQKKGDALLKRLTYFVSIFVLRNSNTVQKCDFSPN